MLTAAAMASLLSSMAPRSDSSASRLCGGTRPTPPPRGWRRLASSMDWTIGAHPHPRGLWVARRATSGSRWGRVGDNRVLCPQPNICSIVTRQLLGDNLHREPDLDLGVQAQRHLVDAEGPNGLVEVEAAAVDLHTGLGLDRRRHVGRRD